MSRISESIDSPYEALMFAKSPEAARTAATDLVRAVLGEEAVNRPLEDTLKECCRVIRPARDPKEEARFEEEFVELAIWPGKQAKLAA
jgi:hypothetical protein